MTRYRLLTLLMTGHIFTFSANAYSQTPDTQSNSAFQTQQQMIGGGNIKAAINSLEPIWKTDNQNLELCQLLVDAYGERIDQVSIFKQKKLAKKMLNTMEACYALNPDDKTAQLNLIMFHLEAPSMVGGDKDIAKNIINDVARKNPERGFLLKARFALKEEDFSAASGFVSEALKHSSGNAEVLNVAGLIAQRQEHYGKAVSLFQRCVLSEVDDLDCQYQIGKTAHLSGEYTREGIAAFQTFIRKGHDNPEYLAHAHYRLAELLLRSDNHSDAIPHLELAIALGNLKSAKKRLAKLKKN